MWKLNSIFGIEFTTFLLFVIWTGSPPITVAKTTLVGLGPGNGIHEDNMNFTTLSSAGVPFKPRSDLTGVSGGYSGLSSLGSGYGNLGNVGSGWDRSPATVYSAYAPYKALAKGSGWKRQAIVDYDDDGDGDATITDIGDLGLLGLIGLLGLPGLKGLKALGLLSLKIMPFLFPILLLLPLAPLLLLLTLLFIPVPIVTTPGRGINSDGKKPLMIKDVLKDKFSRHVRNTGKHNGATTI